jgi:hypothetical protein
MACAEGKIDLVILCQSLTPSFKRDARENRQKALSKRQDSGNVCQYSRTG